jgi:hypothetical protein
MQEGFNKCRNTLINARLREQIPGVAKDDTAQPKLMARRSAIQRVKDSRHQPVDRRPHRLATPRDRPVRPSRPPRPPPAPPHRRNPDHDRRHHPPGPIATGCDSGAPNPAGQTTNDCNPAVPIADDSNPAIPIANESNPAIPIVDGHNSSTPILGRW